MKRKAIRHYAPPYLGFISKLPRIFIIHRITVCLELFYEGWILFWGGMGGGGGRPNQSFIFNEVYKYYPDTVIDLYAGFVALFKLGV